jgi:tryptophanyl-tRNA synthetase
MTAAAAAGNILFIFLSPSRRGSDQRPTLELTRSAARAAKIFGYRKAFIASRHLTPESGGRLPATLG